MPGGHDRPAAQAPPHAASPGLSPRPGALVISLDFELHWGVRDRRSTTGPYRDNLLGAREAIPRVLDLFDEFEIAATWATVGLLFATSREEARAYWPGERPRYVDTTLDPYGEAVGDDEREDRFHYAPSLVSLIHSTPRQELATHTFSHYYCLEAGQGRAAFSADITSAVAIARDRGIAITSIVFPRNQVNRDYAQVLLDNGITCYRGSQRGWLHRAGTTAERRGAATRALRLADAYVPVSGTGLTRWEDVPEASGLCNVPASRFLRPYTPRLRWLEPRRVEHTVWAMRRAAISRSLFHLWWHPHNFGVEQERNLEVLRRLLVEFSRLRSEHGMVSLAMRDVAATAYA